MGPGDNEFRERGPLGSDNMRRQQGRSFNLTTLPDKPRAVRERLVFTGGVGKGNDGIGDAYASAVTIACSLIGRGTVVGLVEWGTDGHSNSAHFDWLNGTTIHVAGASFTVSAELVPDGSETALAEGLDVTVGASIAYWSAGRQHPTRTIYAPAGITSAVEVEIPAFASRLHVTANITPLAVTAEFLSQGGIVLATYVTAAFANGASVPIPNGATEVRLTAGAAAEVFAAIFGLSL